MKQPITATEARAQRQESGFIPAYSPAHRALTKKQRQVGTAWKGLSTADETAKARRRRG